MLDTNKCLMDTHIEGRKWNLRDTMNVQSLKKRFKNPIFRLALASFVYQIFTKLGIQIDAETFRLCVDILSYILIGAGVYTSFSDEKTK